MKPRTETKGTLKWYQEAIHATKSTNPTWHMNGHTITYSTTIHITSRTGTPFFINKSSSEPFIVSSITLPSPSLPNSTKAYFTFTFTLHGLGTPTHPNTVSRFSVNVISYPGKRKKKFKKSCFNFSFRSHRSHHPHLHPPWVKCIHRNSVSRFSGEG